MTHLVLDAELEDSNNKLITSFNRIQRLNKALKFGKHLKSLQIQLWITSPDDMTTFTEPPKAL